MSFDRLALAIANVDINKVSEIELVRIIRKAVNHNLPSDNLGYVGLQSALVIAKALKVAESQGYVKAMIFVALG